MEESRNKREVYRLNVVSDKKRAVAAAFFCHDIIRKIFGVYLARRAVGIR